MLSTSFGTVFDGASGDNSATIIITNSAPADVLTVNPIQPSLSATEGQVFSGRVANFINTNAANANLADFTTTIDWGDGTTTSGTLSNPAGNIYAVDGTHTYGDEGTYTTSVTVSSNPPGTATATAHNPISVAEADVLTVNPIQPSLSATEGQSFSGRVANFVDTNAANTSAADLTASINWGDGTTSAGTVAIPAGTNIVTVDGSHTYADEGNYTVAVTVSDDAPGTATATANNPMAVAEGDVLTVNLAQPTLVATEGQSFSGRVANFVNTNAANTTAADFIATINWGDGTTTAGTVGIPAGTNIMTVDGSHTYGDEGSYTVTVTLSDDAPGTATATATNPITVAEADVLTVNIVQPTLSATEGQSFSGRVANFVNTNAANTNAADFTATINWGDGTITTGTVGNPAATNIYTVDGTHTYADEGSYSVKVTVSDDAPGTATATATNPITVAEGDVLTVNIVEPSLSATEGQQFSGRVANFVNTNAANANIADFTATINWGDGTTTAGTVGNPTATSIVTVDGTHTYADEGSYTISVTVSDDAPGTATATATNPITVAEADVLTVNLVQPTLSATEGQSFSGRVANFVNTNAANASLADFTTTIDWGDGTTSAGTLSNPAATNIYAVDGTHTYAEEGNYTVAVTVSDDAPGTATATASNPIAVSDPVVMASGGLTITAIGGTSTGTVTVAKFTDPGGAEPLANYSATIDWGDGTTSPGTIALGTGGVFSVTGSHTYSPGFGGPGVLGSTLCDASLPHFSVPIVTTIHHESTQPATANSTANISSPSNSAFLTGGGNLLVVGTSGNDQIYVTPDASSGRVFVQINSSHKLGPFTLGTGGHIVVAALAGNDLVQLAGTVTAPSVLYGGPGNDQLNAGNGRGILVGCDGNDTLIGGSANDLLIGDSGADNLNGNAGNDALVAGSTTDDYLTLLGYQSNYNLLIGNVTDDGVSDVLTGAAGTDTLFARLTGPNKDIISGPAEVLRLI